MKGTNMTIHYQPPFPAVDIGEAVADSLRVRKLSGAYRDTFKRFLDIAAALVLLVPAAIILAVIAILVALDGHSPFYRQERIGKDGKIFNLWKMRSMVQDADARLAAYLAANPAAHAEWEHHQKLKRDPRITWIGRIIRKTSLDELPQIWNVLIGEMSLVGPRPMMVSQQAIYPGQAYYDMRPGITGFWQIADRNETSFSERAWYDTRYYGQISLATDLRVMLKTVGVVLRATGH
jgi:exopolysaccharide production protein ExoY